MELNTYKVLKRQLLDGSLYDLRGKCQNVNITNDF